MTFSSGRLLPCLFLLLGHASLAQGAAPTLPHERLIQMAADHLKSEAHRSYPEFQAHVDIRPPDPRLRLPECGQLEFKLAPGAKLYGASSLGVRCEGPRPWALSLGYQIKLRGKVLLGTRQLAAREIIKPRDVEVKEFDLSDEPSGYLREPRQAVGMLSKRPIQAGQPITLDMLAKPLVVRAGQKVRIMVQTPSYTVSQECTAISNGVAGDLVRCKANNGRILQGIATEAGTLDIQF